MKMAIIGDSISAGMGSVVGSGGEILPGSNLNYSNSAWWQQFQERYGIGEIINNSKTGAGFTKDMSYDNYRFTRYLSSTIDVYTKTTEIVEITNGTILDGNWKVASTTKNVYKTTDNSGNILYYYTDNNGINYKVNKTVRECLPKDLDIIIVFGGVNDGVENLGTINDEPSTANGASYYAAVKATLEYLTTNFPDSQIIYFTELPHLNQSGTISKDNNGNYVLNGTVADEITIKTNSLLKVNAIKQLCSMYNVPVCDLHSTSGFNVSSLDFRIKYMPDGLHPNEEGTKIYLENGIYPFFDKIWQNVLIN